MQHGRTPGTTKWSPISPVFLRSRWAINSAIIVRCTERQPRKVNSLPSLDENLGRAACAYAVGEVSPLPPPEDRRGRRAIWSAPKGLHIFGWMHVYNVPDPGPACWKKGPRRFFLGALVRGQGEYGSNLFGENEASVSVCRRLKMRRSGGRCVLLR